MRPGERRRSRRVAVELPVELRFTLERSVCGQACDLSREGLFAKTEHPRPPGTLVRVRLDVDCAEPIIAVGVVVREVTGPRPPRGVGILLTSTSEAWDSYWDDVSEQLRAGQA